MRLSKSKFLEEINVKEYPLLCEEEYAYGEWKVKVQPYLQLITKFRNGKERLSSEQIRMALGISSNLWKRFTKMPTLREYMDMDREVMSAKAQMDIVRAVELKPENAVAVKLQAERFDNFYIGEGKGVGNEGVALTFEIVDGKQSDKEIQSRVDIDIEK